MNFIIILSIFLSIISLPSPCFPAKRKLSKGGDGRDGLLSMFQLNHNWNKPNQGVLCPSNEFAIGASIRTSTIPNKNVTTITTIRLRCSDRIRGKSYSGGVLLGKYYEDTTDWQDPKECSRGFVIGIRVYTKPKPREDSGELDTGEYVSAVRLLCQEERISFTSAENSNSVLFGSEEESSKEISVNCNFAKALYALATKLKSIITLNEGENLAPSDIFIECDSLSSPYSECSIGLEFEPLSNLDCSPYKERNYSLNALLNNSSLESDMDKISCNYKKITGLKLNSGITNLKDIIFAYQFAGITVTNGDLVAYTTFWKSEEVEFKKEWDFIVGKDTLPLPPGMIYANFLMFKEQYESWMFKDGNPRNTITFKSLAEFRSRNKEGEQEDMELTHVVRVEQLVGYCSVFKLYFPVVRKEVTGFIRESSGKVNTIIEFV